MGNSLPCSATDEAWRLLSAYLERYPSQNSLHHRCVINKLLVHGIPLPNWLVNSYKVRTCLCGGSERLPRGVAPRSPLCPQKADAAELLRLYLNYDLLEEAVELVLEYVDAVLGKGHRYFGIEVSGTRGRASPGGQMPPGVVPGMVLPGEVGLDDPPWSRGHPVVGAPPRREGGQERSTDTEESVCPLQVPLSAMAPAVWLPFTAIDQLLRALRESTVNHHNVVVGTAPPGNPQAPPGPTGCPGRGNGEEPSPLTPALPLAQLYQKLHDKVEDYQQKVSLVTRDHLYRCN